jgi:hypothetical protein
MRFQVLDILPHIENPVTGRLVSPAERYAQALTAARRAEARAPRRIMVSTPPTPIASVAISTCPSAGLGSGTSMTARPSGLPNAWIATAFMPATLADAAVRLARVRA